MEDVVMFVVGVLVGFILSEVMDMMSSSGGDDF